MQEKFLFDKQTQKLIKLYKDILKNFDNRLFFKFRNKKLNQCPKSNNISYNSC